MGIAENPCFPVGIFQIAYMVAEIQVLPVYGRHIVIPGSFDVGRNRKAFFCTGVLENPTLATGMVKISHLVAQILLLPVLEGHI